MNAQRDPRRTPARHRGAGRRRRPGCQGPLGCGAPRAMAGLRAPSACVLGKHPGLAFLLHSKLSALLLMKKHHEYPQKFSFREFEYSCLNSQCKCEPHRGRSFTPPPITHDYGGEKKKKTWFCLGYDFASTLGDSRLFPPCLLLPVHRERASLRRGTLQVLILHADPPPIRDSQVPSGTPPTPHPSPPRQRSACRNRPRCT